MKNRLYHLLMLASFMSSVVCQAAEAPVSATIKLGGSEEKTYPVPREEALKSRMLAGFVQQFSGQDNIVPLEGQFSNEILGHVARIMNSFYAHRELHDKALLDAVEDEVKINPTVILLKAFDQLDYNPGKNLLARAIAADNKNLADFLKQNVVELKPLVAHYYYLLKGTNLSGIDANSYGFSIQDYFDYQPKLITKEIGKTQANLASKRINNLYGLDRLPNKARLTRLDLASNQLRAIPANAFRGFSSLDSLSIEENQISQISENAWMGLDQLRELVLDANQLSEIPTWKGLEQLRVLGLNSNKISTIHKNAWQGLSQLSFLGLADNQLKVIPDDAWQGLTQLATLYLGNNPIKEISVNSLQRLARLVELGLENAPISGADNAMVRNALPNVDISFEQRKE